MKKVKVKTLIPRYNPSDALYQKIIMDIQQEPTAWLTPMVKIATVVIAGNILAPAYAVTTMVADGIMESIFIMFYLGFMG